MYKERTIKNKVNDYPASLVKIPTIPFSVNDSGLESTITYSLLEFPKNLKIEGMKLN